MILMPVNYFEERKKETHISCILLIMNRDSTKLKFVIILEAPVTFFQKEWYR